jgi:integrase
MESSVSVYARVIQNYFDEEERLSIKRINNYITHHNRYANSIHIKAPFFHLFRYLKIDTNPLDRLVTLRIMPKKRQGVYLPEKIMVNLIKAIDNKKFRDISALRFFTGIRSFEALMIKEENISKEVLEVETKEGQTKKIKIIKIILTVKGGKQREIYLNKERATKILKPYIKGYPGFLFIDRSLGELENTNRSTFWVKVQTQERYYYRSLQKAARKIGLNRNFGTHDIRRFFAERSRKKLKDIFLVKRLMGHSKIETTMRYFDNMNPDIISAMLEVQG